VQLVFRFPAWVFEVLKIRHRIGQHPCSLCKSLIVCSFTRQKRDSAIALPNDAEPVAVKAVDYEFAHGLTVKQNEFIRQYLREQGAVVIDKVVLERARYELSQAVEALMTNRKHTARRRSAALRGISSNKPSGSEPSTVANQASAEVIKPTKSTPSSDVDQNAEMKSEDIIKSFQIKRPKDNWHEF